MPKCFNNHAPVIIGVHRGRCVGTTQAGSRCRHNGRLYCFRCGATLCGLHNVFASEPSKDQYRTYERCPWCEVENGRSQQTAQSPDGPRTP